MALQSIRDEQTFARELHKHVYASAPITSIEYLRGREVQVRDIERALGSPGRNVFIYGDRGVGKTSLAQTAAFKVNAAFGKPLLLGVTKQTTFFGTIRDLVSQKLGELDVGKKRTLVRGGGIQTGVLSFEFRRELEHGRVPEPKTINEVVALLEFVFGGELADQVVVIDEFERLENADERALFADFLKQLGDQNVRVKFIFCGVGQSLTELLADHHSCYRYLETVSLGRLEYEARFQILRTVELAFDISIDAETRFRICAISDGYPYYIHLVCEKMLWEMYDDPKVVREPSVEHYNRALEKSINSIEPELRKSYETATKKYNDDYQEVLWAVADHGDLQRRSTDIYTSYLRIMSQMGKDALPRDRFNTRINSLKKESHGGILDGTRTGWYSFKENVIRGYVRLRAERCGVTLDVDHGHAAPTISIT